VSINDGLEKNKYKQIVKEYTNQKQKISKCKNTFATRENELRFGRGFGYT